MQWAVGGKRPRDRGGLAPAGWRTGAGNDRGLIKNNRGVLNEHAVRQIRIRGESNDVAAQPNEALAVSAVLPRSAVHVNLAAVDVSQFTTCEARAYLSGYRRQHEAIA
jgi:hypothetical protein